jgi:hypothetical protein
MALAVSIGSPSGRKKPKANANAKAIFNSLIILKNPLNP